MDKRWIWCDDKLSSEYTNGVKTFIELAKHTTPSSRFMQELETLTQRVNDKDNAISELT